MYQLSRGHQDKDIVCQEIKEKSTTSLSILLISLSINFAEGSRAPTMPWGSAPKCPACDRTVYPMEQVFLSDPSPIIALAMLVTNSLTD